MGDEQKGEAPESIPGEITRAMISAGRDITGTAVVGDQNVVFTAEAVFVQQGTPPEPKRREKIDSRPRKPYAPIVGRAALVGELRAAVQAGRPVQLHGPSGVGKSTILRHAARTLPPGPDGVVFLSAISTEIRDLAQQMFEACYQTVRYAPGEAELKKLMDGIRITAYVDNADFSGEQLRWLMDRVPDATFIFAGREPTLSGEGRVLRVTGLDLPEGLDLLARESRRWLAEADRAAAIDLWEKSQGRPLLLVQAAGLVRPGPSGEAVLPRPSAVVEITRLLLSTVDDAGQDVLRLLATLDGAEIAAAHVGALTGATDPARVCEQLSGLGLLLADEDLYRCPPEAVPVIRDRHPEPFPASQLCRHFTTWATDRTTAPDQVARHAAAIAQAARLAEEAGQLDLAVQVARAASPSMGRALRFGPWGLVLGRGWSAAKARGDKSAEAYFTLAEGVRSQLLGRLIGATLIGAALEMLLELGEVHHVAPPAATPATSLPVHVTHVPAAPFSASPAPLSAGSASVAPPVSTATTAPAASPVSPVPGGAATTGAPSAGGAPMTPAPQAAAPPAVAGHGAAAASHMANLANSPVWPGIRPQVLPPTQVPPTAPAPPSPVPSALPRTRSGPAHPVPPGASSGPVPLARSGPPRVPAPAPAIGMLAKPGIGVLAKIAIVIAVLGGMAATRAAITGSPSSSSSPSASNGSSSSSGSSSSFSAPQPTGLAGNWTDTSDGNTFTITANGDGTYAYEDSCSVTVTLTGSGSTYSGQENAYPNTGGCESNGYLTNTFTLDPGGQEMTLVVSMPSGETDPSGNQLQCLSCGTFTLTRASSS